MHVRLLGPVAAGPDPSRLTEPPGRVPAAVLAHLALAQGHVLSPDALAGRVWDVTPDNPRNALQAAVSRLRKAYADDLVETSRAGYRLPVETVTVDLAEARREAQLARSPGTTPPEALLHVESALARFVGEPLAGVDSDAAATARIALEDERLRLVALRTELLLASGRAHDALPDLRAATAAHPYDEVLHALLMRALASCGRPSDALTEYGVLRRRLADELGTDPSAAVADVFAAILAGAERSPIPVDPAATPPTISPPRDVTVLLTDIVGSARLWQEHGEAMTEVLLQHHAIIAETVLAHGGELPPDQGEGDARLAVFPTAAVALEASGTLQQALAAATWQAGVRPHVRAAVASGTVVFAAGNVFGSTVPRCARLRALAHGDQVLVSRDTAELARDALGPRWSLVPLGRAPLRDFQDEDVFSLVDVSAPRSFPPLRAAVHLPAEVATFVGRRDELDEVSESVRRHRVVTLTGIGGSGKTTLALRVARLLAPELPGGVAFVDLSSAVTTEEAVSGLVATLTGATDEPLSDALHALGTPSLLVLDNVEQLHDAASVVRRVLDEGTATLLVTSRGPVGVPGEVVRPVGPLSDEDALALLRDRAHDAAPGVAIGRTEGEGLVRLLGGIPLALELAAGRLRVLGVTDLTDAVRTHLSVLSESRQARPVRQQAVHALLDDAWHGLDPHARLVLATFALFRDPTAATDIVDVCALDTLESLDAIDHLLARGLLRTAPRIDVVPRFSLLELVRRFALDSVDQTALDTLRTRYVAQVTASVERADARTLLARRDDVREAVRAATDRAGVSDVGLRVRLGRLALALGWWEDAVTLLDDAEAAPDAAKPLAIALLRRGREGDVPRGRALLEAAADAGDADAAASLGGSLRSQDAELAHAWYLRALAIDPVDPYALGNALEHEVVVSGDAGPVEARRDAVTEALARRRAQALRGEDLPWSAYDLAKLGMLLRERDAMHALLDGVAASTNARQVATTRGSFERLSGAIDPTDRELALDVLRLAQCSLDLAGERSRDAAREPHRVLVLAGASAQATHDDVLGWLEPLTSAVDGWIGTIVSGGTSTGVSALAAAVADRCGVRSVGYLPQRLPRGVRPSGSYAELRRTPHASFTLAEPVAYWTDLLDDGTDTASVHVLGLGGAGLTALELHLGLALGARVAIGAVADLAPQVRPGATAVTADAAVLGAWLRT